MFSDSLETTFLHTNNNYVVTVNSEVRLPRNCNRFVGLLEQLFELGRVPSVEQTLLKLEHKTLPQLLEETKTDYVMAFSRKGSPKTLEEAISRLLEKQRPAIIIGVV